MTTYDPDTLEQDIRVLRRIVNEFDGTLALDTAVIKPGHIKVGDKVEFLMSESRDESKPLTTETQTH